MCQRGVGGRGAHAPPPDSGRSEGAAGSSGVPHYCVPPQIFTLWHTPDPQVFLRNLSKTFSLKNLLMSLDLLYVFRKL